MTAWTGNSARVENTPEKIAAYLTSKSVTDAGTVHITPYGEKATWVTITIIKL